VQELSGGVSIVLVRLPANGAISEFNLKLMMSALWKRLAE